MPLVPWVTVKLHTPAGHRAKNESRPVFRPRLRIVSPQKFAPSTNAYFNSPPNRAEFSESAVTAQVYYHRSLVRYTVPFMDAASRFRPRT